MVEEEKQIMFFFIHMFFSVHLLDIRGFPISVLQFSVDTNWVYCSLIRTLPVVLVSCSTGWGLSPARLSPLQMPVTSPGNASNLRAIHWFLSRHTPCFQLFATSAHRSRENSLIIRLLVYCKKIQLKNSQMEEMHRVRDGRRDDELPCPHWCFTLPVPPYVQQHTRMLSEHTFWAFMEALSVVIHD